MSANEDESTRFTRRDFGKALGAATAIGAGATASSGTAGAAEGLVDGVVSAIPGATTTEKARNAILAGTTPGAAIVMGAVAIGSLEDSIETAPSADRAILHNLCVSSYRDQVGHEDTFENRLVDAETVDDIEARHGIASAWEDGEGSTGGYDRSLSRIRQYYELPEFNHWHVTGRHLLQLGYAGDAATEDGSDAFVAATGSDGSGNNIQFRFRANPTEVDLELHDGTMMSNVSADEVDDVARDDGSTTLRVPQLHVRDTTNDTDLGTTPVLEQSVVDSWDPDAETLTYDVDGTTCTLETNFVIPNVNDLETARVWDVAETFDLHDQIISQSDAAVGDYSESFVQDIYDELNAGNITPKQVRSPEGVARFLSGTEDQAATQFRLAMLQQLGMARPDLSRVAQMSVTYSGATDRRVATDTSIDGRWTYPDEFVTDESHTGMLYASDIPGNGFTTGNTYAIGYPFYTFTFEDSVTSLSWDAEKNWETSVSVGWTGAVSPDGELIVTENGSTVVPIDAHTGETLDWGPSFGSSIYGIDIAGKNNVLAVTGGFGDVVRLDPDDGSEVWRTTIGTGNVWDVAVAPDESTVVAVDGEAPAAVGLDAETGDEIWSFSLTGETVAVAIDLDSELAFAPSDGTVHALELSTGNEQWTFATDGDGLSDGGLTASHDKLLIQPDTSSQPETAVCLDIETQSELWTFSESDYRYSGGTLTPDGSYAILSGNDDVVSVLDGETGDILDQHQAGSIQMITTPQPADVDGFARSALLFDKESNDEIELNHGTVTIDEQTDAEGATVTHVTDTTISDIEALSATPDSIDTIVSEMDQFDAVEDIKYTKHVLDILENYGADATVGNEDSDDVTVDEPDYEEPKYNTQDSAEYAEYMSNNLETYKEMLAEEQQATVPGGAGGFLSNVGNGVIGGVIILILGYAYLNN